MSHSLTVTTTCIIDGEPVGGSITTIAGARRTLSEDVPSEISGLSMAFTIDVSAMKMLYIISDVDITLTFEGPDSEFILDANRPVFWHAGGNLDIPFGAVDVTSLTVDNATEIDGVLQIEVLSDPTP